MKHLKLTKNHEDFELKKLLFSILVTLSKDPTAVPVSTVRCSMACYTQNLKNNNIIDTDQGKMLLLVFMMKSSK